LPASDLPALADRFQRFGALEQAERLYVQALASASADADLWARLGRVCRALGHRDEAVASSRRALELRPGDRVLWNDLGVALMEQGRLDEADDCFVAAIRLRSDFLQAHRNRGMLRMRQGDPHGAALSYRRALCLKPDDPVAHVNLGDALALLEDHRAAADSYRRAVDIQPDRVDAWFKLGATLYGLGELAEAAACYERAALLRPDDPGPIAELAALLLTRGELDAAIARFEQFLRLRPDCAEAYSNLGLALMAVGRLDEARLSFEQAVFLNPDLAEAHNNLGLAFLNQGRVDEAHQSFGQAIRLRPELADAHNNLGLALDALGRRGEALDGFERAAQLDPHHRGALTNLGNVSKDQGRTAEAIACYRRVLDSRPDDAPVHSNLLLAMQYQAGLDPRALLEEARRYARQHADAFTAVSPPRAIRAPAGRRLRIGYVSADFREHPVAYFLEPILSSHDHRRFEIFGYADVPLPDEVTERCRRYADLWRSLIGLSDAQTAELIRRDGVDILVDLAGHTGGNRLLAFARRPAPIQVSYLGYLGTTGLQAMDYYLTDAHADPPGASDSHYQEQLIRLPECALCYAPGPAPERRAEPPSRPSSRVTFGCLNSLAKVNDEVLTAWSRVLAAVPGSRLRLPAGAGRAATERVREIVERDGIDTERLMFAGWTATRFEYLALYQDIDIALDPFPYNGVTTTCDALWMGVPVVSLAGRMGASRQGVRFLRNVGLDELIAGTPDDYVRIATDLAGDRNRLSLWHSALRERMSRSPLMDATRLTRDLEAAYHAMFDQAPTRADRIKPPDRSG
jgi:predicted O-linked N-acetylglucosamine transferase (SPINDLY family)